MQKDSIRIIAVFFQTTMLDIRLEAYHIGRYPKGENVSFITIKSVRGVSGFLKVGGQVEIQALMRRLLFCQKVGGQLFTYAQGNIKI